MLGPRIAALRRQAGMSQAELARRLKLSPSAVGMYEQGRREPSADTLVEMAGALGVSVDFLLTGRTREPAEDDPESMSREELEKLVADRLRAARRLAADRGAEALTRQELAVLLAAMLIE